MTPTFLVECSDGTLVRKPFEQIRDDDKVVLDGPGAFGAADAAQLELDAEIEAAGGFQKWKTAEGQ
jgi:hypothetical protein